jgi:hypothetical protein
MDRPVADDQKGVGRRRFAYTNQCRSPTVRNRRCELDVDDVPVDEDLGRGDDHELLERHVQVLWVADRANEVCPARLARTEGITNAGVGGPKISSGSIGSGASPSSSSSELGSSTSHSEPARPSVRRCVGRYTVGFGLYSIAEDMAERMSANTVGYVIARKVGAARARRVYLAARARRALHVSLRLASSHIVSNATFTRRRWPPKCAQRVSPWLVCLNELQRKRAENATAENAEAAPARRSTRGRSAPA